jgi:hypothetical protein
MLGLHSYIGLHGAGSAAAYLGRTAAPAAQSAAAAASGVICRGLRDKRFLEQLLLLVVVVLRSCCTTWACLLLSGGRHVGPAQQPMVPEQL